MNIVLRIAIILIAWGVYYIIGTSGNGSSETSSNNTQAVADTTQTFTEKSTETPTTEIPLGETEVEGAEKLTEETETSTEGLPVNAEDVMKNDTNVYASDPVVNRFITEYNSAYDDISGIEQGNIRTKYYGYVRETRIEMINATSAAAEAFSLSIYGGKEESDRNEMFSVYAEASSILDPSLSSDDIEAVKQDLINKDVLTENYPLGDSINVTYVPIKELSYGKTDCRIDLLASNYPPKRRLHQFVWVSSSLGYTPFACSA